MSSRVQERTGLLNPTVAALGSMDYFNPSAPVMRGAHQMVVPNAHGLTSLPNPALGLQQTPTPPIPYTNHAHPYTMGSEGAYMGAKHSAGLPAYPGYPGAFSAGYPYSLPPTGYRGHPMRADAMKNAYPAAAAAAAQEEYLKQAFLNAGKPGVGPYGIDPATLHPGYYPFPSMQHALGPYAMQGAGSKRKLETTQADEGGSPSLDSVCV